MVPYIRDCSIILGTGSKENHISEQEKDILTIGKKSQEFVAHDAIEGFKRDRVCT